MTLVTPDWHRLPQFLSCSVMGKKVLQEGREMGWGKPGEGLPSSGTMGMTTKMWYSSNSGGSRDCARGKAQGLRDSLWGDGCLSPMTLSQFPAIRHGKALEATEQPRAETNCVVQADFLE